MPLIKCENLHLHYDKTPVVHNVSFEVEEGDFVSIVGENGTGKSTLVKGILGLIKNADGKVIFDGISKNEIGYLPQQTSVQKDFPASVKEVVYSGFAGRGFLGLFYSESVKEQAQKNMQLLGISDIAEKSFSELSGGQQQKVLLCRALCAAKKVLLLDEPVTSLDESSTEEMYTLIKKLNDSGLAIIMISHDISRALCEAKNILSISESGFFFGTPEEYILQKKGDN